MQDQMAVFPVSLSASIQEQARQCPELSDGVVSIKGDAARKLGTDGDGDTGHSHHAGVVGAISHGQSDCLGLAILENLDQLSLLLGGQSAADHAICPPGQFDEIVDQVLFLLDVHQTLAGDHESGASVGGETGEHFSELLLDQGRVYLFDGDSTIFAESLDRQHSSASY